FRHVESAPDGKPGARGVEDPGEDVPVHCGGDASLESRPSGEPLEDVGVDVELLVVAVDRRVGDAGEELVVTRVGEVPAVGDADVALEVAVAPELALGGEGSPKERKQRLAAFLGGGPPEILTQSVGVAD